MIQNCFTDNGTSSSTIKTMEQSDDQNIDSTVENANGQYLGFILAVSGGIITLTVVIIGSVACWYMKKKTNISKSALNSRSEVKSINKYSQLLINENQMTNGEMVKWRI